MSLVTYRHSNTKTAGAERAAAKVENARSGSRPRALTSAVARLVARAAKAYAEARVHRAAIEAELYLGHQRHVSKNDDDLPVVR